MQRNTVATKLQRGVTGRAHLSMPAVRMRSSWRLNVRTVGRWFALTP
jgi:hypothetical protein